MKRKIHCLEILKDDFDDKYNSREGMEQVQDMIGYVNPLPKNHNEIININDREKMDETFIWNVNCVQDGCSIDFSTQELAEIFSSVEECKAMLIEVRQMFRDFRGTKDE